MATGEEKATEIMEAAQAELNTQVTRLQEAKANIKAAIEGKGVTVSGSASLEDYADMIEQISSGSGSFACGYTTISSDITTTTTTLTITHGLGVVPDYIYFAKVDKTHNSQAATVGLFGGQATINQSTTASMYVEYEVQAASSVTRGILTHTITDTSTTTGISAATSSSFRIGIPTSSSPLRAGRYLWFAVAMDEDSED